jgi:6-pyruvoyl-tetrahydropterin synthase
LSLELVRQHNVSIAYTYTGPEAAALPKAEGYGDNLVVELAVQGSIDAESGMIVNLVDVDEIIKRTLGRLDHRYINEMPEFRGQVVTPESIAIWLRDQIKREWRPDLPGRPSRLRVFEGPTSWVDVFFNET